MIIDAPFVTSIDEPLPVTVGEVCPQDPVEITYTATDAHGAVFTTVERFTADDAGRVTTAGSLPDSAHWSTPDSLSPFWVMTKDKGMPREFALYGGCPMIVRIAVRAPGAGQSVTIQRRIAHTIVEVPVTCPWQDRFLTGKVVSGGATAPDIASYPVTTAVNTGGIPAVAFALDEPGPLPGVIIIDSDSNRVPTAAAAALAQRGFVAIAVAAPTPSSDGVVDVGGFATLCEALASHPRVNPNLQLAVVGRGTGAELALLLAANYSDLIGPVVAHSPWVAIAPRLGIRAPITYRGLGPCPASLDPVRVGWWPQWKAHYRPRLTGHPLNLHYFYQDVLANLTTEDLEAGARALTGGQGPLLMTAGEADGIWDAKHSIDFLARFASANGTEVFTASYPNTGHGVGYPFTFPGAPIPLVQETSSRVMMLGGHQIAGGHAAKDTMQLVKSFLASAFDISA